MVGVESLSKRGKTMRIENYWGLVVVLELDTMATHEGVLEPVEDSEISNYVRVRNGEATWLLPVKGR